MKAEWSKDWNSSIKPRKQRKYRAKAPLHVRQKFMTVHLSKDLKTKYGIKNTTIRKGDKVQIVRGQYRKRSGEVLKVLLKRGKVLIEGIDNVKKDGTTTPVAFEPTNLTITSLNLEDKKRKTKLEKKSPKEKK